MTIVFNGIENYVQSITVYFNAEGYSKYDYHDEQGRPYELKTGSVKKRTSLTISKGDKDRPDIIFFELYNANDTIYNSLCYEWCLNDVGFPQNVESPIDKLNIETKDGLFRIIWLRKEKSSEYFMPVAEQTVNMKNVEYYWIRSKNAPT